MDWRVLFPWGWSGGGYITGVKGCNERTAQPHYLQVWGRRLLYLNPEAQTASALGVMGETSVKEGLASCKMMGFCGSQEWCFRVFGLVSICQPLAPPLLSSCSSRSSHNMNGTSKRAREGRKGACGRLTQPHQLAVGGVGF